MHRNIKVGLATLAAVGLLATAVWAAAHFQSSSRSILSSGHLRVDFVEAGLGHENVNYTLSANAVAEWACFNRGGKNPSAENKQATSFPVTVGASFEAKNGKVTGSIIAPNGPIAVPSTLRCGRGQDTRLVSITYSNIVLRDTTNGVQVALAPISRVFIP